MSKTSRDSQPAIVLLPDGSRRMPLSKIVAELRALPDALKAKRQGIIWCETEAGLLLRGAIDAGAFAGEKWTRARRESTMDKKFTQEYYGAAFGSLAWWLHEYGTPIGVQRRQWIGGSTAFVATGCPWIADLIEAEGELNRVGLVPIQSADFLRDQARRKQEEAERSRERSKQFVAGILSRQDLRPKGFPDPNPNVAGKPHDVGPEPQTETVYYITLDQAAASVNRSKKTLERRLRKMPLPEVQGQGGKPHEWKWSTLRPWLEKEFNRILPPIPHHATRN